MSCPSTISIFRGDTPKFEFTILDNDESPLDLTGATLHFSAKANIKDNVLLFDRTFYGLTPLTEGKAEIRLTSTDTDKIVTKGIAELSVEYISEGVILTIEQFVLEIKPDVLV